MHAIWCDQNRLVTEATVGVAETGHLVDAAVPPVLDVLAAPLLGVSTLR